MAMIQQTFIAYRRSSTAVQILGLEIQQRLIDEYVTRIGGVVVAGYHDVGTAARSVKERARAQPNLERALLHARSSKATIVASRLDRLTRSTSILADLMENGPAFVIAELPSASPFVLQIYAAMAEEYRRQVSRRVKGGMKEAKARGSWVPRRDCRAGVRFSGMARRHAERMRPIIEDIRRGRILSGTDVSLEMNGRGLRTVFGRCWTDRSARNLWKRFYPQWDMWSFPGNQTRVARTLKAAARTRARDLRPVILQIERDGARSGREIANRLNAAGWRSINGRPWGAETVNRLRRRQRAEDGS
jgi:DNA invertase Pin-like site-specific DNA recombinase